LSIRPLGLAEEGSRQLVGGVALEALIGTGRHVENPEADDEQPDETHQPNQRGHFVLAEAGDNIAGDKRHQHRQEQNRQLRDSGWIEKVAREHESQP
jgi:hypothetical protein